MNKLNIDNNNYSIKNYFGEVKISEKTVINVNDSSSILLIDNEHDITFVLENNASLIINNFSVNKNKNSKIKIKLNNNSSFKMVNSYQNNKSLEDKYEISINGNNNKLSLIVNALAKQDMDIYASIDVLTDTIDNDVLESVKVYECGGSVSIKPILYVNTSEVFANHKAVITNFEKENLFYLKSKGLNTAECINVIKEGFMLKDFEDEFKEKIRKEYYE